MKQPVCRVPEITHEQWLAFRRTGIGGSDASTVVGLNPYSSLYYLYNDKLGLLPPKDDTEAMRQGRDLEQYVADRWMEATGKKCKRNNYMWRSVERPFMLADIDREVCGENAGLECKTTSVFNRADLENGEIPLTYYVQCQRYMAVMGFDAMYLAVLVLNRGFYHFRIDRDNAEIDALAEAERAFWEDHILPQEPPDPDGSEATYAALSRLHPEEGSTAVLPLSRQSCADLTALADLEDAAKAIKQAQAEAKARIMAELGDAAFGEAEGWLVSWKSQTRTTIDAKALKRDFPQAYEACAKQTTARVFRARRKTEE